MGRGKIFFLFNIFFILALFGISYQTFEKKKLESNIKNFSEEEKIERVARDKLNLKKEGEVTYKIVE